MDLIGLKEMNLDEVISDSMMSEVFAIDDPVERARVILTLEDHAATFRGGREKFKKIAAAYQKSRKSAEKFRLQTSNKIEGWTAFEFPDGSPWHNMRCGVWIADETGIWKPTDKPDRLYACPHPILPVERLKNLETGEEKIRIAYKRNNTWFNQVVNKSIAASANKIIQLADFGVMVTSECAKNLVKYLSEVETYNEGEIRIQKSTTKLGWHGDEFIPFDATDIEFDGDKQFSYIREGIKSTGSYSSWMDLVKSIRATRRIEPRMMLAASFASPLIEKLGILPFFVDLYGMTEGGKTVSLMLAASVYANPGENRYIGDFRTTDTALEIKADMLSNLPMLLDDTAKADKRISDNFEAVIYNLCSGRGKGRANKELGISRTYGWNNVFISNGESPLTSYVSKGGALNRVIEVECGENVYSDPAYVADVLKANFGWAGPAFIRAIQAMGQDTLKEIYNDFSRRLNDDSKMKKQTASLACLLTADKIATDTIFRDGIYIGIEEAKSLLLDKKEVSDGERCYQMVIDKIEMNRSRFDIKNENVEQWGVIDESLPDYVLFYPQALDQICESGGFKRGSFLNWAEKQGLLQTDGERKSRKTKNKKIGGRTVRLIFLKILQPEEFVPAKELEKDEIPFD